MWTVALRFLGSKAFLWLSVAIGLGAVYWTWKDSIEEAVFSKIELATLKDDKAFLARQLASTSEMVIHLRKQEKALHKASEVYGNELRKQLSSESCLVQPLSDDDVRVLNAVLTKEGRSESANGTDSTNQ